MPAGFSSPLWRYKCPCLQPLRRDWPMSLRKTLLVIITTMFLKDGRNSVKYQRLRKPRSLKWHVAAVRFDGVSRVGWKERPLVVHHWSERHNTVFQVLLRVSRRRRLRLFFFKTLAPTSTTTCNAAASPTFLMRLTFQVTMTCFYSRHGSTYGGTSAVIQAEGTKLPSNVSTNGCAYSVSRGAPASSSAAEQEHWNTRRSGQIKWWSTFKVWNPGLWWRRGRGQ